MTEIPESQRSPPSRAVLFDVDGTLAETEGDGHRVAFNQAFADAGIGIEWVVDLCAELLSVAGGKQRFEHYFLQYESRPAKEAESLSTSLHLSKTSLLVEIVLSGQIGPRPGVRTLVHDLQNQSVVTAIVTTGRRAWVEPLVTELLGVDAYDKMRLVVTGDDVSVLKPSPEAYLLALRKTRPGVN